MHRTLFLVVVCLAVVVRVAAQSSEGLRDDLSRTLDAMTVAVLAAEADAYLEHIAVDEPEFRVEQIAWANDLSRITPFVVAYDIISEPVINDNGEAIADLV
ncbi:MAG: hypothetical protein AAFO89_09300, partial [Planctomycetota bacterium]